MHAGVITTFEEATFADGQELSSMDDDQIQALEAEVASIEMKVNVGVQFPVRKVQQDPENPYMGTTLRRPAIDHVNITLGMTMGKRSDIGLTEHIKYLRYQCREGVREHINQIITERAKRKETNNGKAN